MAIRYLHSMIRVSDPDATIAFFNLIGLEETRRFENEKGRFTLIFLAAPRQGDVAEVELTHNWDESGYEGNGIPGGRNFGHLAYRVDNIYESCQRLMDGGVTINRPPRDGHMAFVRSPDNISIELLQAGERLEPALGEYGKFGELVTERLCQFFLRRKRGTRNKGVSPSPNRSLANCSETDYI